MNVEFKYLLHLIRLVKILCTLWLCYFFFYLSMEIIMKATRTTSWSTREKRTSSLSTLFHSCFLDVYTNKELPPCISKYHMSMRCFQFPAEDSKTWVQKKFLQLKNLHLPTKRKRGEKSVKQKVQLSARVYTKSH